ncbi:hypothetical protein F7725_021293 [Dissostichus mawsoni]|uniref:Olfactory receptor n=1 Tax=Dissostichus mawsoni TaxID=36200 RepID=A0A7J5YFR8_DISMA|nr:hypothetical protein F7725_021293 [Dissostichus mawsoni]
MISFRFMNEINKEVGFSCPDFLCNSVSIVSLLVSLLNFSFGCSFEMFQSRFDMSGVPSALRIILSLYFLIIQPLMNPVMYGLQMSKLRNICKHVLCYKLLAEGTAAVCSTAGERHCTVCDVLMLHSFTVPDTLRGDW